MNNTKGPAPATSGGEHELRPPGDWMRSWKGYGVAVFVTHSFNNHEAATVGQTWAQPWVKDESGMSPVLAQSPIQQLVGNML